MTALADANEFTLSMQRVTELMHEFTECINEAGTDMRQAAGPEELPIILDKLARSLSPVTERYSLQADNCRGLALKIDQETQTRLANIKATPREQWSDDTLRYLGTIKHLSQSMLIQITSAKAVHDSLDGFKGRSTELDKSVERLQSVISTVTSNRSIFQHWLVDLSALGY